MSNPVLVVRQAVHGTTGEKIGQRAWTWCPACQCAHAFVLANDDGTIPPGPVWTWDGNLEAPTFQASMLVTWQSPSPNGTKAICHSFLEAGRWRFLDDCTHALAGQTDVEMAPLPDWLLSDG